MAQTEFDRQAEVTRLLLEGISSTHVSSAFMSSWVLLQGPQSQPTNWSSPPPPAVPRVCCGSALDGEGQR